MIFEKIKNLNYLLIFLLILISFIGAAGLYSAADGSYQPWASRHLIRFYVFLLMAIVISFIDIKIIKKAMFQVVNENKGTAFKSRLEDIKFAGKTGTSQVRRISLSERESDDFREKEQEWKNRDHALFVGYMPHDDPKYAISVIIEHGGSGASTAAPIAKQVFNYINELEV